jgi:hypothetical protein
MFGTLIIQLPSIYTGGELVVQHKETKKIYDLAKDNEFQFQFIAFFADCEHELKPVTSGHRLCLVYNMIHPGTGALPTPVNYTDAVARVANLLKIWEEDTSWPSKVAILLDHKYTKAGLSFAALKGSDLAKAEILRKAREQADFDVHLVLITYHESGYPADGYNSHQMEITHTDIEADNWISMADNSLANFPGLTFDKTEIFPEDYIKDSGPTRQQKEATGNEGTHIDRWYESAALIIWPRGRRWNILAKIGKAVGPLKQMVDNYIAKKEPVDSPAWKDCVRIATMILDQFNSTTTYEMYDFYSKERPWNQEMTSVVIALKDVNLCHDYITKCIPFQLNTDTGRQVASLCDAFGWEKIGLSNYFKDRNALSATDFLLGLVDSSTPLPSSPQKTACEKYAQLLLELFEQPSSSSFYYPKPQESASHIVAIFKVFYLLDLRPALEQVLQAYIQKGNYQTLLVEAIKSILSWLGPNNAKDSPQFISFIKGVYSVFTAHARRAPVKPTDWARSVNVGSCRCADCQGFKHFLSNPKQQDWIFAASEKRRRHVERHSGSADVVFSTEHTGNPYRLKAVKTLGTYEWQVKMFNHFVEGTTQLEQILSQLGVSTTLTPKAADTDTSERDTKRQKKSNEVIDIT